MAFWNDAMQRMQQMLQQKPQTERQPIVSNRVNGGFSGYQPRVDRGDMGKTGMHTGMHNTGSIADMMPGGVDAGAFGGFRTIGGQGQQTRQPQQGQPQQGQPQQGQPQQATGRQPRFFRNQQHQQQPYQPHFGGGFTQQQPMQPQFQQPVQPVQPPFQGMPQNPQMHESMRMNQPFQVPQQMNQPVQPMQPQQPVQPMQQQPVNQQHSTYYFPGAVQAEDGAYSVVMRVVQITGVTSCFRVIEFMYNNEAVIVNAEMITDLVEADRCMDLIFGAACAFRQRLIRVSGKQIYLITPPQVRVESYDNMLRAGVDDIDRRWPGARQMNMQNHAPEYQQQPQQPQHQRSPRSFTSRQDDFAAGFGRRASRAANQGDYTDYGGFGMNHRR